MRPSAAFTPDMINMPAVDIHRLWADMVRFDRIHSIRTAGSTFASLSAGRTPMYTATGMMS